MNYLLRDSCIKFSNAIGFILIAIFSILIYTSELIGYTISMYTSIPPLYWILFFIPLVIGIANSVFLIATKYNPILLFETILLMFITRLIFSCLPILKGISMWGTGDPVTHLYEFNVILNTGHFASGLYYPISHVLLSCVTIITNSDLQYIFLRSNYILFIPAILGVYLLARELFQNKTQVMLYIIITFALISGFGMFFPISNAYSIAPLFIFLFLKASKTDTFNSKTYMLLSILFCILYIPFHPHAVACLIIIFCTFLLFEKCSKYYAIPEFIKSNYSAIIILLLGILFFAWYSSFGMFKIGILKIADSFSVSYNPSQFDSLLNTASTASSYGYNPIEYGLRTYYSLIIILFFTLIALYFIYRDWQHGVKKYTLLILYPSIAIFISITILLYIGKYDGYGPERFLGFATLFGFFAMIYALHQLFFGQAKSNRVYFLKIVILFLFILGWCSMNFAVSYPSPFTLSWSPQYVESDKVSIDWIKANSINFDVNSITLQLVLQRNGIGIHYAPFHFNYNSKPHLGSSFDKYQYLLINKLDQILYIELFPNLAKDRWYSHDFLRLDNDFSVNKIHTVGETNIWLISPQK